MTCSTWSSSHVALKSLKTVSMHVSENVHAPSATVSLMQCSRDPFGDLIGVCRFTIYIYILICSVSLCCSTMILIDSAAGVDALGLCLPATITVLRLCPGKNWFGETKQTPLNLSTEYQWAMKFNEIQCSRLFELMRQELSRSESPQHQWFGEGHFKFEEFTRSQHRCWRSGKTIKHPFALSQLCRCATEASINQNHFWVANCCYLISGRDPCHPVSRLREDFSWVESELNPKTAKTARHREYGSQASGHACRELSAALDESTSWTEAALAHPRTS